MQYFSIKILRKEFRNTTLCCVAYKAFEIDGGEKNEFTNRFFYILNPTWITCNRNKKRKNKTAIKAKRLP